MTENTVREIVHRAVSDAAFRGQLRADPAKALAGISLTAEERGALTSGDPARLTALGIDQRMSKVFTVGFLGEASKVVIHDPDIVPSSVSIGDDTSGSPRAVSDPDPIGSGVFALTQPSEASTWDAHLRMNEGNLDTGATALDAPGAGGSAWDAHLQMNEGNIDVGSQTDAPGGADVAPADASDAQITQ